MNLKDFEQFNVLFREEYSTIYNALTDLDEHALRTAATLLQLELNAIKKELEYVDTYYKLADRALMIAEKEMSEERMDEPEIGFYADWLIKAEEEIKNESKK